MCGITVSSYIKFSYICCFAIIRRTFNELIIDTHNSITSGGIFLCKVLLRQSQFVQWADIKFKGL